MSNDSTSDDVTEEQGTNSKALAVTNTYKVLGEFSASNGVGVLGQNNAGSGTPIGVQGAVPNNTSGGFGLATPHDARIKGTLTTSTTFKVFADGNRVLRADAESGNDAGNVVAGHSLNEVKDGAVGAVIGGGGGDSNDAGASFPNLVTDNYGTVGGGQYNQAGSDTDDDPTSAEYATVGGGTVNRATGAESTVSGGVANDATERETTVAGGSTNKARANNATVGGGDGNEADGSWATVPGGRFCEANGDNSFATGTLAMANNNGAFVWADSTFADFKSDQSGTGSSPTGPDTFHVRATGGIRLVTGLDGNNDPDAGVYLSGGGSSWQTVSARSAKHDVTPVDPDEVLEKVNDIEVSTWAYDANPGATRMGPMAGEFHDAFGLGDDPETIGHVDADGVALAAIQGLSSQLEDAREDIKDKDARIEELEDELSEKDARIENLEERLTALEAQVGATAQPADD